MKNYKNIVIAILLLVGLFLGIKLFNKEEPEIIKVPVLIEVPIPGKVNTFPAFKLPLPKKVIPRPKLVKEFIKSDSITKDSLYQDAVTERQYSKVFKDGTQVITVGSKVQGKLLEQDLQYEIFKDTIKLDTFVKLPTKSLKKIKVYGGLEFGSTLDLTKPVAIPGIIVQDKKDRLYKVGFSTEKQLILGAYVKF